MTREVGLHRDFRLSAPLSLLTMRAVSLLLFRLAASLARLRTTGFWRGFGSYLWLTWLQGGSEFSEAVYDLQGGIDLEDEADDVGGPGRVSKGFPRAEICDPRGNLIDGRDVVDGLTCRGQALNSNVLLHASLHGDRYLTLLRLVD